MYYDKQIRYIDYLENGEKRRNCGYVKMTVTDSRLLLEMRIRDLYETDDVATEVVMVGGGVEERIGTVLIQQGSGSFRWEYNDREHKGEEIALGENLRFGQLERIKVQLSPRRSLRCVWKTTAAQTSGGRESQPDAPVLENGNRESQPNAPVLENRNREIRLGTPVLENTGNKSQPNAPVLENRNREIRLDTPVLENTDHERQSDASVSENVDRESHPDTPVLENTDAESQPDASVLENMDRESQSHTPVPESADLGAQVDMGESDITEPENTYREKEPDTAESVPVMHMAENIEAEESERPQPEPQRQTPHVTSMCEDKWQQLQKIYPHIRPFQDQREYLSLRPEDFVILHSGAYRLVQNSFLLHGYFNYDHLILTRMSQKNGSQYYIGVPGNFFEKEKQVAIMYGFESFECRREPADEGEFGYYMIRVEL